MNSVVEDNRTSDISKPSTKKSKWPTFWATVGILFMATAIMIAMSARHNPSPEMIAAANERAFELLSKYSAAHFRDTFPDTEALLNDNVDQAFAPAYANVEKFVNLHYTVTGEYTELWYAATGQLAQRISTILFPGLEERLSEALAPIGPKFRTELTEKLTADTTIGENPEHHRAVEIALSDMHKRFETSYLMAKGGGALGASATVLAVGKAVSAGVAKKLAVVTGTKAAAKAGAKVTGSATLAATGAAIGSVVPFFGTAAGAVVGGIIGWVAVDKIVVEAAEYFNRDNFEAEVIAMIDQQKELTKSHVRKLIKTEVDRISSERPIDIIRGQNQ